MINTRLDRNELISKAEDFADDVLRKSKTFLPTLGRLCLVSTFIEDAIRMYFQWNEQRDYINHSWGCGYIIATLFVIYNLFVQLIPSILVLIRFHVLYSCIALFSTIIVQTFAYKIFTDLHFLSRNFALIGALLLLYAESKQDVKTIFAGVPTMGDNKPKNYLQLSGRILVVLMFATTISFRPDFLEIVFMIGRLLLMICIMIGFKTKLSALILVIWLLALNVWFNAYWQIDSDKPMRDFLKYDFYQTMSIIGGLMLIVSYGPGGVSLDEHKKKW